MAQTIKIKRSSSTASPTSLADGELAYSSEVSHGGKLFIGIPGGTAGDVDAIGGKYYIDRSETAYNWGDHATQGYLTTESDPVFTASPAFGITSGKINNWDTAYGWGDHALEGYLVPADITGKLDKTGGTMTGNLVFNDNVSANFGGDMRLFSDGTSSFIYDASAGGLVMQTTGPAIELKLGTLGETAAKFTRDGAAELYHDGTKRLYTDVNGVVVDGNLVVNGTTTTINTEELTIADNNIVLNGNFLTGTPTENAGISVRRGGFASVALQWNEGDDDWEVTTDGTTYTKLLTAANWGSTYTGSVDGGTF